MYDFISGAIAVASLVIAIFFFNFYRKVRDPFFILFALAFCIYAIERFFAILIGVKAEVHSLIYIFRLFAFTLIIIAIWNKNRQAKSD